MKVRLGLKALDFIREIDFSLTGKKGRGGEGERNKKEVSNKMFQNSANKSLILPVKLKQPSIYIPY